jgi:colicin import membrane protein
MNDLVVIESLNPLTVFTESGLDPILDRIEKEAKSILVDISTEKGRKEAASLAYKIAQSKTALDKLGKDLVADWKEQAKKVDVERARAWDRLETLQKEVRSPLTEWENKEKERVAAHEAAIAEIDQQVLGLEDAAAEEIERRIARCIEIGGSRGWEEFTARAKVAHDQIHAALVAKLAARSKHEAEQAELARLRQEELERKQREREATIAAEAAAKANAEAEAKAREEAGKAERMRLAIQQEKEAAEARATKAEADRIASEEKAKSDALAAAEKAERDRVAAAEQAKRDAEAAAQRERDKIEAERKAEAEAAAKREADKKHRAKINNDALHVLKNLVEEDKAKAIIEAIARGHIPHLKIEY